MTLPELSLRNLLRNPLRSLVFTTCVALAFLIFGLAGAFTAGSQGAAGASDTLIGTMSKAGRAVPLPLAYRSAIAALPEVEAVAYSLRLRGFIETEGNVAVVSAADPDLLQAVTGADLGLDAGLIAALKQDPEGVLVGRALAAAQGLVIGQRFALTAFDMARGDGSRIWSFRVAGIFEGRNASTDTYFMIGRYDRINGERARQRDTVDVFAVRPKAGVSAAALAPRIDALFANSAAPTRSQSERQFLEAFLRQFADTRTILRLVLGAAFASILLILGNGMLFALSERRFEIGVLKSLGFAQRRLLLLVMMEVSAIVLCGGMLGLGLAAVACALADPALGLVLSLPVLLQGAGLMLLFCLLIGLPPALGAMRMPVIQALNRRS